MSSVDSSLNSSATVTLQDFYRRFLRRDAGERDSMLVLHGATIFWAVLGTGAALAMIRVKTVLDVWWQLAGLFGGGMLGLFLLGRISSRAGSGAAFLGVAAGVFTILWTTFSQSERWPAELQSYRSPLNAFLTIVVGTLAILIVGTLASIVLPRKESAADQSETPNR